MASNKDEIDYLTRSVKIQLTEIYKNYEQEKKKNKPKNSEDGKGQEAAGQQTSETKRRKLNSTQGPNANAKTYHIHKYSNGIPLAEAVIVAGKPFFIQMTGGSDFFLLDKLPIDNLELKPKDPHSYLCKAYVFESSNEIKYYLELA